MVYFRIHSKAHQPQVYRRESMTNAWIDWKGLNTVIIRPNSSTPQLQSELKIKQKMIEEPRLSEEEITRLSKVNQKADEVTYISYTPLFFLSQPIFLIRKIAF